MKTAMKNTAHRDDLIFLLCQPILCLITPCLGCSMFFGPSPCFFVIGVIHVFSSLGCLKELEQGIPKNIGSMGLRYCCGKFCKNDED